MSTVLCILSHLIIVIVLYTRHYYLYSTDQETEIKGNKVLCPSVFSLYLVCHHWSQDLNAET